MLVLGVQWLGSKTAAAEAAFRFATCGTTEVVPFPFMLKNAASLFPWPRLRNSSFGATGVTVREANPSG
jgi:hypothetical protein